MQELNINHLRVHCRANRRAFVPGSLLLASHPGFKRDSAEMGVTLYFECKGGYPEGYDGLFTCLWHAAPSPALFQRARCSPSTHSRLGLPANPLACSI